MFKIYTAKGKDTILGASFAGGPAGDLISMVGNAMSNKIGLQKLGASVYPYPTYAELIRNMGDAYNKTRLGPKTKVLLRKLFF